VLPQSGTAGDHDPSVSADHLTLFFHSARSGVSDLYVATRASLTTPFGAAALVPGVNDPAAGDAHPYFRSAGGGELWLTSLRGGTTYRIFRAKQSGTGFASPELVPGLSGAWHDWQPMITEDGRSLLFSSTRPGGQGGYDLWTASRASDDGAWEDLAPLSDANSPGNEFAGWLSADRCRVYFSSNRDAADPAVHRIFVAARPL
jgi:Tol biopolymer transport system component